MKKQTRERVDITVDREKRAVFNALFPIHGKTLSDIMDEAIDALIVDVSPDLLLEMSIKETEIKLAEMKENLIEARYLVKQQQARAKADTSKEKVNIELGERLQALRSTKYEETKKSLAFQVKRRTIDWKRIQDVFEFPNQLEAKEFVMNKLTLDELI